MKKCNRQHTLSVNMSWTALATAEQAGRPKNEEQRKKRRNENTNMNARRGVCLQNIIMMLFPNVMKGNISFSRPTCGEIWWCIVFHKLQLMSIEFRSHIDWTEWSNPNRLTMPENNQYKYICIEIDRDGLEITHHAKLATDLFLPWISTSPNQKSDCNRWK